MAKRYLITGGAGFIGSNLADKLIEEENEVLIIDNLYAGKKANINPSARFHQLDICDYEKIRTLFRGIDCVFHLAAVPRVPFSIEDPISTSKVNILGTVNVFKAAADAKVKRIVFASSSSVFGPQPKLPFKEDMEPNPISPYGLQKLVGEQFAKMFSEIYKTEIICLRYFNVYGPRIDFDSDYSLVLGKFLRLHKENKPLTIYGDGEQTRAFCYIDDVVEANIKASESPNLKAFEVINIGQEKSYSINYLARLIGGSVAYLPPRQGDPKNTQADITKAKALLSWQPTVDFKEGVDKTKEWFVLQYDQEEN